MDAKQIVDAMGGVKETVKLTGLTRGRIYQFMKENHIPRPWLMFFHAKKPKKIPLPKSPQTFPVLRNNKEADEDA